MHPAFPSGFNPALQRGNAPVNYPNLLVWYGAPRKSEAGSAAEANYLVYDGSSGISQLTDLSGNGYHATQGTPANRPIYLRGGTADWSTGAPSIYVPGTGGILQTLNMPAALVALLSGTDVPYTVIGLSKGYSAAPVDSALIHLAGAVAFLYQGRVAAGNWRTTHKNTAAASETLLWAAAPGIVETASCNTWQSTQERMLFGSPLVEDANSPKVPTATGDSSYTSGHLLYGSASVANARAFREMAIFADVKSVAAMNNIVAGMIARSSAAA